MTVMIILSITCKVVHEKQTYNLIEDIKFSIRNIKNIKFFTVIDDLYKQIEYNNKKTTSYKKIVI